jgi:NitT/TauT family transport system ATP-binding protein
MTIIFKDISKRFAKQTDREVAALDSVSFEMDEHQFVSIIGPSGCGKTTLLKIVAGLVKPDRGEVQFSANNASPSTALVFQEQGLLPWLTVMDNIGLGLEMQGVPVKQRKEQILEFMQRVKLSGFEDHYPHELSGGMRQRVALARAFLTNPDILLMDEPFGSLDAQTRIILQEELLKIWRVERNTVLFVTHDIDEAIMLSDRVIVLTDRPGHVHADISIDLKRPRDLTMKDEPLLKEIRWKIWKILENEVRKDLQLN